jgi:predicted CoA-substrate-specific enzyme activase
MSFFMGIDIGSTFSKGVINKGGIVSSSHVILSGANYRESAIMIRGELLSRLNLRELDIENTVATGVGAGNVPFSNHNASDILATARGIKHLFPMARTAIDLGGQSTRVIRIEEDGSVTNFIVSEKCAAGSGKFVEVIANVLRIELKDFGPLSILSRDPVPFSTGCAVFGESEAITRIAEGRPKEDIAAGVNRAIAKKASSLAKKVRLQEPVAICGGGALNIGLIKALEEELGVSLLVPSEPQIITALGASIIAGIKKVS